MKRQGMKALRHEGTKGADLGPMQLRAAGEPSQMQWQAQVDITAAGDGEGSSAIASFSIHAYTGGMMRLPGVYLPVVIDLAGGRSTAGQVKILRDHDRSRVLGHAEKVDVNARGIFVSGLFSGDDDEVGKVTGPHKKGFQWEASIGAFGERMERLEEGKQTTVNGRTFTGPCLIARQWALKEVSFVAIGADEHTSTSIAAAGTGDNDMNFTQWLKAHGFDADTLSDELKATLKASYEAELQAVGGDASKLSVPTAPTAPRSTPPAKDAAPKQTDPTPMQASAASGASGEPSGDGSGGTGGMDFQAALRAESVRISRINSLCAKHSDMTVEVNSEQVPLAAHAIEQGWDVDKVELHVLRASRPQSSFGIVMRDNNQQLNASAVEAALCISAGFDSSFVEKQYDEKTLEAASAAQLRGIGIQGLMRICLAANGGYSSFASLNNDMIEAAFRADPKLGGMNIAATGFSTISLSGILSNLANKAMLERYQQIEGVWDQIASVTSTNNFKPFTRYRLDSAGQLKEVGPDGELKHISLTETTFTNRLKTEGGIIALTRQMMIDDDLGAFLQIPQIFGELAAYALEETTFRVLMTAIGSFFSSGNNNYIDGADSDVSSEGLAKAVKAFRQKKGPGGRYIIQNPALLLVGAANEAAADAMYTSTNLGDGSTSKQKPKENPHRNKYKPVVSPFLDANSGLPNASDKHWALLSKPTSGSGVVQVAFLNGRNAPVIESAQANFSQLGMEFRSYHDFGIREFDENAGVWSKGEA